MASAGRIGGDEKWGHAAMEYIYERRCCNDPHKRQDDVGAERELSRAFDLYATHNEHVFNQRLARLTDRMTEALEAMRDLGLTNALGEAVLLNSEQPPENYRRPSLTPPLPGYEPGFGLDVPQLKSQQAEYPSVQRLTDTLEFGGDGEENFPFVDAHRIDDLATTCLARVDELQGACRQASPLTGIEGEAWEAYMALQKKAFARQKLICDLTTDPDLYARYSGDPQVRSDEWRRRGMLPLEVEPAELESTSSTPPHFAQVPAYEPFRAL